MNSHVPAGECAQQNGLGRRCRESEQAQGRISVEDTKFTALPSENPIRSLGAFG